jgi:hypothetical protein
MICLGQDVPNRPQISRLLESAAERPGAQLIWSSEVGRLESGATRAVFTVLAIEDPARAGHQLRGIRVAASSPDWNGTIYVEEPQLEQLKAKVDLWATGAGRASRTASNMIYSSACPGDENLHLPMSFAVIFRWQAADELLLAGAGYPSLSFTGPTPSSIAAIFARATDELKSR